MSGHVRTHWEGCWRDPAHHACAVDRIERLEALGLLIAAGAEPRVVTCTGRKEVFVTYWVSGGFDSYRGRRRVTPVLPLLAALEHALNDVMGERK